MNIRPYELADLPRVLEIYRSSIRKLAAPYYTSEQLLAWAPDIIDPAQWRERVAKLHTLVAELDAALVGFISYNDEGYLDFLFTHPAFARRGVATRLYHCVESTLRTAGVRKIFTHASLAARPFFDRHGFQVDAEENVECRGAYLHRFAMHKQW